MIGAEKAARSLLGSRPALKSSFEPVELPQSGSKGSAEADSRDDSASRSKTGPALVVQGSVGDTQAKQLMSKVRTYTIPKHTQMIIVSRKSFAVCKWFAHQ